MSALPKSISSGGILPYWFTIALVLLCAVRMAPSSFSTREVLGKYLDSLFLDKLLNTMPVVPFIFALVKHQTKHAAVCQI